MFVVYNTGCFVVFVCFFFQAEDGIRDLVRSRGLGDVYKRQSQQMPKVTHGRPVMSLLNHCHQQRIGFMNSQSCICLLYTSDAADERSSVDLGGRRIIKKKTNATNAQTTHDQYK